MEFPDFSRLEAANADMIEEEAELQKAAKKRSKRPPAAPKPPPPPPPPSAASIREVNRIGQMHAAEQREPERLATIARVDRYKMQFEEKLAPHKKIVPNLSPNCTLEEAKVAEEKVIRLVQGDSAVASTFGFFDMMTRFMETLLAKPAEEIAGIKMSGYHDMCMKPEIFQKRFATPLALLTIKYDLFRTGPLMQVVTGLLVTAVETSSDNTSPPSDPEAERKFAAL